MIPAEIIEKKRDGIELTPKEIDWFIHNVISEEIDDCQISALLMSIYFNGMTNIETKSLVNSMVKSGKRFNFKHLGKYVADKHSTGGIGDKISFVLTPLLSSFGIIVPMIAGRGLAFTGGTIDKLESIKNFQTQKDFNSFNKQIDLVGCGIISQSSEICPADKKLYSIRDLTGTIPSFPLICSSIMSKKLAEGLDGLVLDVKVGNGAFMKNLREAKSLGIELKKIGDSLDIDVSITYSNMSEPLGKYAGLKCEITEAVDCLKGTGPDDVTQLSIDLCANILVQSGISANKSEAKTSLLKNIENGKALEKFEEMVVAQNGDLNDIYSKNNFARNHLKIKSKETGYIKSINTEKIGWALVEIGCGKKVISDTLDYSAGIKTNYKVGDKIYKGDIVYELFGFNERKLKIAKKMLTKTFVISDQEQEQKKLIIE
tara:strand:+ start:2792 stop:4081 length:1290 start_codon:yes stop_codon:yes gene_type:complete